MSLCTLVSGKSMQAAQPGSTLRVASEWRAPATARLTEFSRETEAIQEQQEKQNKLEKMFEQGAFQMQDGFQTTSWFDANEVAPGLWLGALPAEQSDIQEFKTRSITHVLRCGLSYIPVRHEQDLTYLKLDVVDLPSSDILKLCKDHNTNAFIDEGRKAGAVLVHCQAGVSRSATVVAAYLMGSQQISSERAIQILRSSRPIVCPNVGFRAQLQALETTCKFDLSQYQTAPSAEEFTPAERVARGNEWLAKRQQADAPEPPAVGIWKPKLISPTLPPDDVLAEDADDCTDRSQRQ